MAGNPAPGHGATCPSGRCREGSLLIGMVGTDGAVRYLGGPAPVSEEFVARAQEGRTPESRFRFAEPCARESCKNWAEQRCTLADALLLSVETTPDRALPRCGIRRTCVWYAQAGGQACRVCPFVVHSVT
jgi:hypothetical protein